MGDFIAKYWLQVLFGLITGAVSILARHYYKLWKQEKQNQQDAALEKITQNLKEYFQNGIEDLKKTNSALLKAVFEVQKKQFKIDCKYLLEIPDDITFEQFEDLHSEYEIYKSLGGNGSGSTLFDLVQNKYSDQIMQKDFTDKFGTDLVNNVVVQARKVLTEELKKEEKK